MSTTATSAEPTIRLRRSDERGFEDFGWADNWMTFSFANYHDQEWMHFGPLRVIVENHIQPHEGFDAHPHRDVEILTYVSSGILTHGDSFGHEEAHVRAGEMQLISAGRRGMVHSEQNVHDEVEHNLQMWIVPDRAGTEFAYHQLGFSEEERQGQFRCYIAPKPADGRAGYDDRDRGEGDAMPINTDAFVYGGLFAEGDETSHALGEGRGAWVQVVHGTVDVAGVTLEAGDGAGITETEALDFSFSDDSELLLFDVRMDAPRLWT